MFLSEDRGKIRVKDKIKKNNQRKKRSPKTKKKSTKSKK